jgi:hypothetical protein
VSVFEQPGIFSTWGMQTGEMPAGELARRALDAGAAWVAGQWLDENVENLEGLADACADVGVAFGIWDASPDAWRTSQLVQHRPAFYIAQAEGYPPDWGGIVDELGGLEAAVVTNFEGLDDELLQAHGFACLPECYRSDQPTIDPVQMRADALARGYQVAAPCLGAYGGYPLSGYPELGGGFSVWNAETMTAADWNELARRCSSPPPPDPDNGGDMPEEEWWEHAYKGGPMVAVKGFPRPLYPPDSNKYGKGEGSVDGPDVEGIKRTVSRLGRWKWQAFDQAFSNAFSHGKSGNVIDTGVAGVQRQQKITPDTGYVGEKTFNTLRSARCPKGPHEGEMAMDARSVELINAAWDRFKGKEPSHDSSPGSSSAQARLAKAKPEVGVTESPANSNQQKYGSWYGMNGVPWCAIFCTWADQLSGAPASSFARGSRYSYVPYIVNDARIGKNGLSVISTPKPGDLVCYDWSRDGEYDHIGIVETPPSPSGDFTAIEGNTSPSSSGSQSNGGQVCRRSRNRNSQGTVFVRIAEP